MLLRNAIRLGDRSSFKRLALKNDLVITTFELFTRTTLDTRAPDFLPTFSIVL